MYVAFHRDLSVVWNCNGEGHKSLGETSESIFKIFWCSQRSSGLKRLSGRKYYREPRVRVSKNRLTRIEERSYSQSTDRGVKDPNTTQWRRGPMGRTAKLVKQFSSTRLNFDQGVGKGATYRQSALIPTCDAPGLTIH